VLFIVLTDGIGWIIKNQTDRHIRVFRILLYIILCVTRSQAASQ
jgi:hypothetical protein